VLHEYHVIYSVLYYPRFHTTAVGLGTYYPGYGDNTVLLLPWQVSANNNSYPQGGFWQGVMWSNVYIVCDTLYWWSTQDQSKWDYVDVWMLRNLNSINTSVTLIEPDFSNCLFTMYWHFNHFMFGVSPSRLTTICFSIKCFFLWTFSLSFAGIISRNV
jgi:hypothetical protein